MKLTSAVEWDASLLDPTGLRKQKPRKSGLTMVIDKGLGIHAFEDLLQTAGDHIDLIKIGFGTSVLYPRNILQRKIELAKKHNVSIYPGGTFLEIAVHGNKINAFFAAVTSLGFNAIEISDGTIDLDRNLRNQLIMEGIDRGLYVVTEYGKKTSGVSIDVKQCIDTIHQDIEFGANLVTVEGRESGVDVGMYDKLGKCKEEVINQIIRMIPHPHVILWETPLKSQQVYFIQTLGADSNLGNIAPEDILSVESLRRGLRSDTFKPDDRGRTHVEV